MKKSFAKFLTLVMLLGVFFSFPFSQADALTQDTLDKYVKVGKTYYIRNHSNAGYLYCPDNPSSSKIPYLSTYTGVSRQTWKLVSAGTNLYYIECVGKPGYVLNLQNSSSLTVNMELKSKGLATSKWRIGVQKEAMMYGTYRIYNSTNTSRSLVAYSYNDTLTAGTTDIGTEYGYAGWVFEEVLSDRNDAAPPAPHNGTYGSQGYFSGHYARDVASMDGTKNYPLYADKDGVATYWYSKYNGKASRIGNFVTIKHNDGSGTLYAHLEKFANGFIAEKVGDSNRSDLSQRAYVPTKLGSVNLRRGQIIGNMGQKGSAMGVHVHLENFKNIDQVFGSASNNTWIYSPNYNANVRDPKNYMKLWWS